MFEAKIVRPRIRELPAAGPLLALLTAAILAAGYAAQAFSYLNHDVAWVLYSSRLMLHGAVFGTDIIAANPPLIWWISTIPNRIAELGGFSAIETFRASVLLLAAAALFASDRFLIAARMPAVQRALFLAVGAYLLTIGVSRDFGQREHFAAMLVPPYALAVAHRMDGRPIALPWAIAAGIAGGVGVAFKPYFLLVPLLLETALLWRTRSPRLLVRAESLSAAATIAAYGAAVLLFARPWWSQALPEIARVYWAFEQSNPAVLIPIVRDFSLPLLGVLLVMRAKATSQILALSLAAAGFFGAAVLQGKYYSYHLYPAYALLVLAFIAGIAGLTWPRRWIAIGLAAAVLISNGYGSALTLIDRSDRGELGRHMESTVDFVDAHVPTGGSFLAVSTHPYPGFPTALYASRRWASPSNSAIFLPAVVRLREEGANGDRELLAFAERDARAAMMRDLDRRPDLVLIDRRSVRHAIGASSFDYLAFYLEDPRFRREWTAYEPTGPAPAGFAAFIRKPEPGQ